MWPITCQPQRLRDDGERYPRRCQRQQRGIQQRLAVLDSELCSQEDPAATDNDPSPGQSATDHSIVPRRPYEQDRAARPPNKGRHQEPPLIVPGLERFRRHGGWGGDGLVAGWSSSLMRRFRPLRLPAIHCRFATPSCKPFSWRCQRSGLVPQTRNPASRPRRPAFPDQPKFRVPARHGRR